MTTVKALVFAALIWLLAQVAFQLPEPVGLSKFLKDTFSAVSEYPFRFAAFNMFLILAIFLTLKIFYSIIRPAGFPGSRLFFSLLFTILLACGLSFVIGFWLRQVMSV